MVRHVTVIITAPDEESAHMIANKLVEEKLCACVNIIPGIRSIYRWEGEICDDSEVMLVGKTAAVLSQVIVERVRELHSYDLPEIIFLPVITGSGDYLDWIDKEVDLQAAGDDGEI